MNIRQENSQNVTNLICRKYY